MVERFKSGFTPPGDIPFEDLHNSKPANASSGGSSGSSDGSCNGPVSTIRSDSLTIKGTMSVSKLKKRGGIFGLFSSSKVRPYSIIGSNHVFPEIIIFLI